MNRFILLSMILISFFSISFHALAQDEQYDSEDFAGMIKKWGAKIGGNVSTFGAIPADERISSKFGLYFGAYSRSPISDNFIMQFELGYNALGAQQSIFDNQTLSYPVGYLTLGALAKFFPAEEYTGLNVHVGLQYGYMIYASNGDLDMLQSYNGSDFDIIAGVGFDLESGLNFEIRYLLGLSNIWNKETTGVYQIWKNRAFQFQIGWTF